MSSFIALSLSGPGEIRLLAQADAAVDTDAHHQARQSFAVVREVISPERAEVVDDV
jgi:hypothetical protein